MTLERFMQVRDFLLKQIQCDPPVTPSEVVTVILFAERWIRLAADLAEARGE